MKRSYTLQDARRVADSLGVVSDHPDFFEQLRVGMQIEHEHDDVIGGDSRKAALIALAHLREDPLYYVPLTATERFRDGEPVRPLVRVKIDRLAGQHVLALHFEGAPSPVWSQPFGSAEQARTVGDFLRANPTLAVVYAWMLLRE